MNKTGTYIRMKPDDKMYLIEHIGTFIFFICSLLFTGHEDKMLRLVALWSTLILFIYLFCRYWYYHTVMWEVTDTQIKSTSGILRRTVNYIELYRVVDYLEEQTLLQQIFGIKDIHIISGDRTDPSLRIYGIPNNLDLVKQIKPLVNKCRKENQIYEIANR